MATSTKARTESIDITPTWHQVFGECVRAYEFGDSAAKRKAKEILSELATALEHDQKPPKPSPKKFFALVFDCIRD